MSCQQFIFPKDLALTNLAVSDRFTAKKTKIKSKDMQMCLLSVLKHCTPAFPFEICYLFYSTRWSEKMQTQIPIIFDMPDFPEQLKPVSKALSCSPLKQ